MNNNIDYLYETLEMSNISLLGYTSKVERIKDEFIYKLPHIDVGYIDSSFSIVQWLRNHKIDNILSNKSSNLKNIYWVVIDIGNVITCRNSDDMELMSRSKVMNSLIRKISDQLISLDNNLKLLITSPIYSSPSSKPANEGFNFMGVSNPLYMADFAFIMKEGRVSIIKNRFDENLEVDINELKNYNYICSYEYIK